MTKADELALFDKCAKKFPADSYVGSFFAHIRPQLEQDTRNDVFVFPDLHKLENEVREAKSELSGVKVEIVQAKMDLEKVKADHRRQLDWYNREVSELRQAARQIRESLSSSLLQPA